MKHKAVIITAIIFFLLVNTAYYWEGKLGMFGFPAVLIMVFVYIGLLVAWLRQVYLVAREKGKNSSRLSAIILVAIVLALTFFKPTGLVDFSAADILVAESKGAANCSTTLKLKVDKTFIEKSICYGISEITGNYRLANDTVYFYNVEYGRQENGYYTFAVIQPPKDGSSDGRSRLVKYRDVYDHVGSELQVTYKNLELYRAKKL